MPRSDRFHRQEGATYSVADRRRSALRLAEAGAPVRPRRADVIERPSLKSSCRSSSRRSRRVIIRTSMFVMSWHASLNSMKRVYRWVIFYYLYILCIQKGVCHFRTGIRHLGANVQSMAYQICSQLLYQLMTSLPFFFLKRLYTEKTPWPEHALGLHHKVPDMQIMTLGGIAATSWRVRNYTKFAIQARTCLRFVVHACSRIRRTFNPSRSYCTFIDPERMKGLVGPSNCEWLTFSRS